MQIYGDVCSTACVRIEDHLRKWGFYFHHVCSWHETRVRRPDGHHLYPLSHLAGPHTGFLTWTVLCECLTGATCNLPGRNFSVASYSA